MKPPWIEDLEYCEREIHTFIKYNDGTMKCHYCNLPFSEFLKRENERKRMKKNDK